APPKPQVGIIHDFYIYMRSTAGLRCFCRGEMQGNLFLPPLILIFGFALDTPARQNTSKLAFALAYSYLCLQNYLMQS
ncbi:MAG: hypothetical protein K1V68_01570, partial [Alistipes sp.]